MPESENIKVAVRVRPFNSREIKRNAKLVVSMSGKTTTLVNPNNPKEEPRKFDFDYSYWSHDGYKELEDGYRAPKDGKYIDQTGSGKSYSIVGSPNNSGLVPRVCEELFKIIDQKKNPDITYEVTFSMLEIYNEEVRDLLNKKKTPHGGLKIKENVDRGFYVEGLSTVPVGSYREIRLRMTEGERQRTIAATKMNETSSRAHTIVAIKFAQNQKKKKVTKLSTMNLVDLAGSERAKQSEATGDRFEEAKNINKSLMTLGSVIKGLCDKSKYKNASIHIPYRDSVLTKLLKNALGGNSKTIMVAAIGPDAENYEQTLSTLRYANRAKSIKTDARVNQEATNKIIQELIAEKERLLKELESAKHGYGPDITKEVCQHFPNLTVNSFTFANVNDGQFMGIMQEMLEKERQQEEEEKKMSHFMNLNEDPSLTGKLVYLCRPGTLNIGNGKDGTTPDITLNGLRLRFGSNSLFVFIDPQAAEALKKQGRQPIGITYEYAQDEIARNSGFNISSEDMEKPVEFSLVLVSAEARGQSSGRTEKKDPFWEPPDTEAIVGVATVPLSYLAHMLEFEEEPLSIVDYQAKQAGFIKVGKPMHFKIKVIQAFNLPERFEKTWCQYKFYEDTIYIKTKLVIGSNPSYSHEQLYRFKSNQVDHKFIAYLTEQSISVEVWGQQGQDGRGLASQKFKRQEERQKMMDDVDRLQKKLDKIKKIVDNMSDNIQVKKLKKILNED
ncbi:hypothetical protein LSH36_333g03043 [Paralvinella palmiformis]|uniref:Kinesin-like protein n=1 Tax=Paralvinella palmiformis TaxID=53620 RepID=A0AAD9JGI1_9ANNE|nr:hypothetical protein LSH36_333g03043 [Paralvinella palmiformis]